ncbi:hypothetical protein HA075_26065 [bacterium BFN5]|nr:hypothetical protein HA075_26065 [bacterium BFN5]
MAGSTQDLLALYYRLYIRAWTNPRCKQGALQAINGKNGKFWGCTKFPTCRATYNDKENKPDIPENKLIKNEQ